MLLNDVEITPAAEQVINNLTSGVIFAGGGGCSGIKFYLAENNPTDKKDEVIVESTTSRLVTDYFTAIYLAGSTIDFVNNEVVVKTSAPLLCSCSSS